MMDDEAANSGGGTLAEPRGKRRALIEIAIAYGLILAVIWTPRPLQRLLWLAAAGAVAAMTCLSFEGLKAMGLRGENFFRSLWVVGAALALAAIAVVAAANLHTLLLQSSPMMYVKTYWAYAIWTFVQQFLMQCFFLARLLRMLPGPKSAAFAAAALFALAHLPNPILAPVTLVWGFAACLLFLRYRNLYPLGMAHAIFGITLAITIPGPVVHNMRVGLGYLTFGHRHRPAPSGSTIDLPRNQ
jgi:hypothetical protein